MQKFPIQQLKEWFLHNRRSLPWRDSPTPYRVWISEVMLQQTQVSVVIPYFERWMKAFPTIEKLGQAPIEQVLKCWEGLGYYSRARNIHQAAIYLVSHHRGELPSGEELAFIKGIGPYTQGAIRSFAFKQKAAAVDGNVLRVLSRFLAFEEEIDKPQSAKKLHHFAETILPNQEPWLISEALIELGAMVCTKKPKCHLCPLRKECLAYRHQLQHTLPNKRKRPSTIVLKRAVAVVTHQNHYLVKRGENGKVMADLYEFPYLDEETDIKRLTANFEKALDMPLTYLKPLASEKHSFTRYRVQLFPHRMEAKIKNATHEWKQQEELKELPFSSGHRRIVNHLFLHENFTH